MPYKDPEKQRAVQARYYQENKAAIIAAQNVKRNLWRREIQEIKSTTPCAECEETFPYYIMDFDHRPGVDKKFNVAALHHCPSYEALLEEIAKCDVVCANCHRHRTFMRLVKTKEV
jgi:hypothetical protein